MFEERHNIRNDINKLVTSPACLHKKDCFQNENVIKLLYHRDVGVYLSQTFKVNYNGLRFLFSDSNLSEDLIHHFNNEAFYMPSTN